MGKVADVKLLWNPSASEDVMKQVIRVIVDGEQTMESEIAPEVSEVMIEVAASRSVMVTVDTTDKDGLTTTSEVYAFRIGDLVAPLPATNLRHEIVAVRDVE